MDILNWITNNAAFMGLLAAWVANAVIKYLPLFGRNVSAVHAFVKLMAVVFTKIDAAMSGTAPTTPPTVPGI